MSHDTTPTPYTPTPWVYKFGAVYADQGRSANDTRILLADRMEPETSGAERDSNLKLSTHAVNSYAKHCGPHAIRCAEDDLLGQALEALRYRKDDLDNQYSLTQDEEYEMERIESILSRLPH